MAVRRKGGAIVIREQPWEAKWSGRLGKVPFVRGAVTLVESMHNGYSALRFSADQMEMAWAPPEGMQPVTIWPTSLKASTLVQPPQGSCPG